MSLWSRIGRTFGGSRHRSEIDEELQFHLEMDVDGGRDRREARLRLGNVARIQEDTRAVGVIEWLESALRDARYGLRQLRRTPMLTAAILLSLAIGIGANAAIFSLVDAAILKPMPVPNPDSLVILEWTHDDFPPDVENVNGEIRKIAGGRNQGSSVSASLHRQLAAEIAQSGFDAIVGIADPDTVAMAVTPEPAAQVSVQYVSANFFQGLRLPLVLGRAFEDSDDRVGAEPVVIVSHRLWSNRLGGRADALDRRVRINSVPVRIVGVAPPRFFGLYAGQWTDLFAPLAARVAFQPPGAPRVENERDWWVRQMARVAPGISEAEAVSRTGTLFASLTRGGGSQQPGKPPELVSMPGSHGFNWVPERDAGALQVLMLIVGLLLLIVCANVANLLLSRSVARQREFGMRLALGASRQRLVRQHLIESSMLALLGGAAGLGVGYALAQSIHWMFQAGRSSNSAFDLHIDPRIVAYTVGLSMLTALLFGLVPAMRASRSDLNDVLKAQTRTVVGGRLWLPRALVAVQIALSLGALISAALLGETFGRLKRVPLGFDRENLAYVTVVPSRAGYTPERMEPYATRLKDELLRIPGVTRVSTLAFRALSGMGNNGLVNFSGRKLDMSTRANMNSVGVDYFDTVGIPLVAGRKFEALDLRPNANVAIVDQAFVARYLQGENPIGRRFGWGLEENSRVEIIGVVGNGHYNNLRSEMYPTVYEPFVPGSGSLRFAIRSAAVLPDFGEAVRRAVANVDPVVPVADFNTQSALVDRAVRIERLLSVVSGGFGAIALILAAVGLGGLLAYTVARRTTEIGVRMALGGTRADVVRMVLLDSLRLVGAGVLLGAPCTYVMTRALQTSLFQVEPFDPATTVFGASTLLFVALIATWIPARRAAAIDPMGALRQD